LSETLQAYDSAKAAYRQSWSERYRIIRIAWASLVLSFTLVTVDSLYHLKGISGHALHELDELLMSVIYVALLRYYILGEDVVSGRNVYFKIGRREIIYALWTIGLNLLLWLAEKLAPDPKSLDIFSGLVIEYGVPLAGAIFLCILYLTWPYLAAAERPVFSEFNDLNKAIKGNVESILVVLFYIFLPYSAVSFVYHHVYEDSKTSMPLLYYLRVYLMHALFCVCSLVEISFMAEAYKKLWLSRPG
jgi:hypothetical protein